MLKNQQKSKQLQHEELKAIAGGGLNDPTKKFSLRNKYVVWVSVAVSIVGIFAGMTMPVQADDDGYGISEDDCEDSDDSSNVVMVQISNRRYCFDGPGEIDFPSVGIANVVTLYARNNSGYVVTNKGTFSFWEYEQLNFIEKTGGPVTVKELSINGVTPPND